MLEIWIPDMLGRNFGVRKPIPAKSETTIEISSINKYKPPDMR